MRKPGKKLNSTWGATLVICAAILISSLATATASSLINGARLKNGTVTGKKVKRNTLTGKQIKESSLSQVPSAASATNAGAATNSAQLGGLPASAFVRGDAHVYSASATPAINVFNSPLLTIPGVGRLLVDCNVLGEATFDFQNESGENLTLVGSSTTIASTNVSATPYVPTLPSGTPTSFGNGSGGTTTFQAWPPGTSGKNATITISNQLCSTTVSALVIG